MKGVGIEESTQTMSLLADHAPRSAGRFLGLSNSKLTMSDVIYIAALLRRKLPDDLVPLILDYAEMWIQLVKSCDSRKQMVGKTTPGIIVLTCTLPKAMPANHIRKVQFTTTSRARRILISSRGPLDPPSQTWFEVGVRKHGHPYTFGTSPGPCPGRQCVAVDGDEVQRHRILVMDDPFHSNRSEPQTVIWDTTHEDEDVRSTIKRMKGGDTIELSMFVCSRSRANFLLYASIEVEAIAIRKL